tara:strand:+ start:312 stop:557 length:246 start_codon:yes stop_codon:yes gene_type:complete
MSETYIVSDPNAIAHLKRVTLKLALETEILTGMNRGRKQTAYSIIKSQYGLKGNRQRVLKQFKALIEEQRPPDQIRLDGHS